MYGYGGQVKDTTTPDKVSTDVDSSPEDTSHRRAAVIAPVPKSGPPSLDNEVNQDTKTSAAADSKARTVNQSSPMSTNITVPRLQAPGRKPKAQGNASSQPPQTPLSKKKMAPMPHSSSPLSDLSDSRFLDYEHPKPDLLPNRGRLLQSGVHAGSSSQDLLRGSPRPASSISQADSPGPRAEDPDPTPLSARPVTRQAKVPVPAWTTGSFDVENYELSYVRAEPPFTRNEMIFRELSQRAFDDLVINWSNDETHVAAGTMHDGSDSVSRDFPTSDEIDLRRTEKLIEHFRNSRGPRSDSAERRKKREEKRVEERQRAKD